MAEIRYTLTKEDEGLYIKELLRRRLLFSSRLVKKIKVEGEVFLNDKPAKILYKGKCGDVLRAVYPEEESYFEPQNIPIEIPYEDEDLLVVNKPAGLIVHPTKNFQDGTLANAISWHINERGDHYKLRFVNRLDMNTSGLVIVAKNAHAQDFLSHEMDADRVVKKYLAVVYGKISESGTVNAPIDKDPNHVARRMVTPTGYPSVTHYSLLENFGDEYSLLELKLDTGRTHQIRVHMTYLGHPIAGDDLYGPVCGYNELPEDMQRQALHAAHLEFTHPVSGKLISVDAPLPYDMQQFITRLRK